MHKRSGEKRGDSLIEVMFSVGVFALVAVGSVGIMNQGLYTAQNSLEITMARNEIDAQAEALRFIHAAYTAEKNANITPANNNYSGLWENIIRKSGTRSDAPFELADYSDISKCADADKRYSYVINYHQLGATNPGGAYFTTHLDPTPTHPRLMFSDMNDDTTTLDADSTSLTLSSAQGIWVTTVREGGNNNNDKKLENIEYFDFYIRTCWDRLGGGTPNTISTVIRLYNPDYKAPGSS